MDIVNATRKIGKKGLKSVRSFYEDHHAKKAVLKAMPGIEEYRELTPKLKKLADEYSVDVLGSKRYAPWLYVYSLVRGEFREGWIPDNFFGKVVLPVINKELGAVARFKSFSKVVLKTEALPDVAYYIDGIFYNKDFSVTGSHELRKALAISNKAVFVKIDGTHKGQGVIKLPIEELNESRFQRIGNCVIQSEIKQHKFFEDIISGSVATIRITTAKDKSGRIDMRAAYLRLGRKDTAWVRSDNSVRVAITNKNGELDTFGYTQDWRRWLSHPDSGVTFENMVVPKFKEAIEFCLSLHNTVPHISIVGWDIAVSDTETLELIEWNSNGDIIFSEATTGPCFLGLGWEKLKDVG